MNENEREYAERLLYQVVGACYEVSNVLGAGFLEKVYERALLKELRLRGIAAEAQVSLVVNYKDEVVGDYCCDILVEGRLIIELKCCDAFADIHIAQALNYLRATRFPIALLVNFQKPKLEWQRVVSKF
jgi:GxxExxY protein